MRVHDEYLGRLAGIRSEDLTYCAISLVGPPSRIDKLVHRLSLLG